MNEPIRVLIVDDQDLIRSGFALILETDDEIAVVGEAGDGGEALRLLERLAAEHSAPDVVLMDVRMPGVDGIEATGIITRDYPQVRVLVLTTFDLDEVAIDAIEAGASGFLLKDARAAELIGAVRSVAQGDSVLAPSVTKRVLMRMREGLREEGVPEPRSAPRTHELEQLTERELEVFTAIAAGLSNAEIGEQLFLSESTVKTHVGRIFAKLALRDRVQAVIRAYELGVAEAGQ